MFRKLLVFAICGLGHINVISTWDLVCPESTFNANGTWVMVSDVCVLHCIPGFRPTGCHLLRQNVGWRWLISKWNHPIPECEPRTADPWLDWIPYIGFYAAVVLLVGFFALPAVLPLLGFGAVGITALSWAAWIQTPFTAAGSLFATLQSAGMVGFSIGTKFIVGTIGAFFLFFLNKILSMFSVYGECK